MPTYLCHGFRWHRRDIRIFVILNDLDDAASNWVIGPATSQAILSQLHASFAFIPEPAAPAPAQPTAAAKKPASEPQLHHDDDLTVPPSRVPEASDPVLMHSWSAVKLLEEFDPEDTRLPSRPYAFVADYVVRVDLSANVVDEMAKYRMRKQGDWFGQLRDELQKGEDLRWYVVVCGDELREVPADSEDEAAREDDDEEDEEESEVESVDQDGSRSASQEVNPQGLKPPPARPAQQERPRTSPQTSSASSLPIRPSPLSSHPANPRPSPPPEPGGQRQAARPPLKSKKSMAEGLRRLFGKKDGSPGTR
ncbi:hypothetical protein AK830_g4142 [Neonectria ditissima]|uniref:Developmental regulator n=1 Tax=Neonectria ditissima TaxID=78410 RepID=A0A0P7AWM3_9HYPO|nr:hypothetical protein AK830_g4142 [Neonectria ditissima]